MTRSGSLRFGFLRFGFLRFGFLCFGFLRFGPLRFGPTAECRGLSRTNGYSRKSKRHPPGSALLSCDHSGRFLYSFLYGFLHSFYTVPEKKHVF